LIGTKNHPNLTNKILILEEVNEPGFRISRLFNHLEKAELLDGLKAIILGDFLYGDEFSDDSIEAFIESHPNLPIYRLNGFGHGEVNKSFVLGKEALIRDGVLEFGLYNKEK
jgi:muramoyltetrapeptide carboxypeptidase